MNLNQFTHLYPISKTLRFELKPVGETSDYIENFKSQYLKDIVKNDIQRASDYDIIKEIIDDYHRYYIEEKLSNPINTKTGEFYVNEEEIENAFSYFQKFKQNPKDDKLKKEWNDTQILLRKQLVKVFSDRKKQLFGKELITKHLPEWLQENGTWEDNKRIVENFNKFTTYFTGFHENRENMYSAEEQSTAISYRLINENLPKFFINCIQYSKIKNQFTDIEFKIDSNLLQKMGVSTIFDIFQPRYFIKLFTQTGIDNFLELLGGYTKDDGEKVKGLNEFINLYRQKNSIKSRLLPNFTALFKQILSDRETNSFIPLEFNNDNELLESLHQFIAEMGKNNGVLFKFENAVQLLQDADLSKTYIKGGINLTDISQKVFGNYGIIKIAILHYAETIIYPTPKNGKISDTLMNKRKKIVNQEIFSISELESMVLQFANHLEDGHQDKEMILQFEQPILNHFLSIIKKIKQKKGEEIENIIQNVLPLLELENLSKGKAGQEQTQKIQTMLDAFLSLGHAIKPLHLVKGRKPIDIPDIDMGFYAEFSEIYEIYENLVVGLYNKTRNHLTKKPFSTDKIKINFENPTLLDGWDANKEKDNSGVLFEKNGNYYLGIMHPKYKNLFNYNKGINDLESVKRSQTKDELFDKIIDGNLNHYKKIVYKLLPGANKMLPKVFFSGGRIDFFAPSNEVLKIRNTASHSKNGAPQKGFEKAEFNLKDCHTIIDFFKESIEKHPEWREFKFNFSATSEYNDLSDFYREVAHQGYKMDFHPIKDSYINQCIQEGKLFLFQIYNKDFSPFSSGKPNLHTLYWKALFDPENIKDVVAKLNGQAEIFYRKHSIKKDERTIHKANTSLQNKNENNPKKDSNFNYDIIKDKRYTVDKFQFHVPITLNFKAEGVTRFNDKVNHNLATQKNTHVIGIDRGERHLLYYSVINPEGKIVEQGSLNRIDTDQNYSVDYQQKLDTKEKARDKARKAWTTVDNIKDLKAGYLSHVVHKLAFLIVKYNAIICLEDLNFGFKRGRFKVEKQVYQKFEKALIDKLNYLVFKDAKPNDPGHVLNALQLSAPFESFKKLGKQTGLLYYVRADYTSKIDPVTGFINFLYPKYESLAKSKIFFESFDGIRFNSSGGYFEFKIDYKKMTPSRDLIGYQTKWVACSFGDKRFKNIRNANGNWESVEVNVTEELKLLLKNENIEFKSGLDLRFDISSIKNTKFYKKLFKLLQILLSLRHSKTGTDEDFILSPIADNNGVFFDSRNANKTQPKDADANGAYNIALKGLWNIDRIKNWDGKSKLNLAMKNVEWFEFALNKPFLK